MDLREHRESQCGGPDARRAPEPAGGGRVDCGACGGLGGLFCKRARREDMLRVGLGARAGLGASIKNGRQGIETEAGQPLRRPRRVRPGEIRLDPAERGCRVLHPADVLRRHAARRTVRFSLFCGGMACLQAPAAPRLRGAVPAGRGIPAHVASVATGGPDGCADCAHRRLHVVARLGPCCRWCLCPS